jgi:hypothetical protein
VPLRLPTWLPLGLPVDVLADGLSLGEGVPALVLLSCDSVVAQPYRAAAIARTAKETRFIETSRFCSSAATILQNPLLRQCDNPGRNEQARPGAPGASTSNFVRQVIEADLAAGVYPRVARAFPRSRTATSISATPSPSA